MVRFAPNANHRISKRGLVLAGASGETVLFEHPRSAELPTLLADDPTPEALTERLGPPLEATVIADLVAMNVLEDSSAEQSARASAPQAKAVTFTRSGIMFAGIAAPSHWLSRCLLPLLLNPVGGLLIGAVVVAGIVALLTGRPDLPGVSSAPAVEALLMMVIGMSATVCHELAHAVTLAHYGRTPRRAGFGFYWGALSFFVDSTPALTLPRNQRVIQALAGLAVDVVTTAAFAIAAHLLAGPHPLLAIVLWRLAILGCVDIVVNLAPILQVDGHWALADWLDEPDLGPRARRALGLTARRRLPAEQRWLAAYGAFSLLAGLSLLGVLATVFWATTKDLVVALFSGNVIDVLIGVYYVGPIALGLLFSVLGLVLETVITPSDQPADSDIPPAR